MCGEEEYMEILSSVLSVAENLKCSLKDQKIISQICELKCIFSIPMLLIISASVSISTMSVLGFCFLS